MKIEQATLEATEMLDRLDTVTVFKAGEEIPATFLRKLLGWTTADVEAIEDADGVRDSFKSPRWASVIVTAGNVIMTFAAAHGKPGAYSHLVIIGSEHHQALQQQLQAACGSLRIAG